VLRLPLLTAIPDRYKQCHCPQCLCCHRRYARAYAHATLASPSQNTAVADTLANAHTLPTTAINNGLSSALRGTVHLLSRFKFFLANARMVVPFFIRCMISWFMCCSVIHAIKWCPQRSAVFLFCQVIPIAVTFVIAYFLAAFYAVIKCLVWCTFHRSKNLNLSSSFQL